MIFAVCLFPPTLLPLPTFFTFMRAEDEIGSHHINQAGLELMTLGYTFFFFNVCMCECMHVHIHTNAHMFHRVHVEVGGQLAGLGSPATMGSRDLNSGPLPENLVLLPALRLASPKYLLVFKSKYFLT